ncbi:hypothetical protein ABWH93_12740 [Seohaeicola saemankumensis]|uniref:hypothetical protein n=1 Tax=Seohaeicola TaxID=481178 RepID=UPI0035D12B25
MAATLLVCGGAAAAVVAGFSLVSAEGVAVRIEMAPRTTVGVMTVELAQGYTVTRRFTG